MASKSESNSKIPSSTSSTSQRSNRSTSSSMSVTSSGSKPQKRVKCTTSAEAKEDAKEQVKGKSTEEEYEEVEPKIEDLAKPALLVAIPIFLSLVFVCVMAMVACNNQPGECYHGQLAQLEDAEQPDQDVVTRAKFGAYTALMFIVPVICVTFLMVLIFYFQLTWFMYGYVFFAMTLAFSMLTTKLIDQIALYFNMALDMYTAMFIVWNIAGGAVVTFFILKSPKIFRQGYLIFLSVNMALMIILLLPPFTTWLLLFFLVLWDLFAVLTPFGPLRMIIEMITKNREKGNKNKKKGMELPEVMIYNTYVYNAATIMSTKETGNSGNAQASTSQAAGSQQNDSEDKSKESSKQDGDTNEHDSPTKRSKGQKDRFQRISEFRPQLGMGDFIFYSLLVGKTWTMTDSLATVIFVILTVQVGLLLTLILLVKFKKALPALPISLTLALVVVGVTALCTEPFGIMLNVYMIYI